jgi:hypothetical protein
MPPAATKKAATKKGATKKPSGAATKKTVAKTKGAKPGSSMGRELRKAVQGVNQSLIKCRDPYDIFEEITDRFPGCGSCKCWCGKRCGKHCCDSYDEREVELLPLYKLGEAAVPYAEISIRQAISLRPALVQLVRQVLGEAG